MSLTISVLEMDIGGGCTTMQMYLTVHTKMA